MLRLLTFVSAVLLAMGTQADSSSLPTLPGARFDTASPQSTATFAAGLTTDGGRSLRTGAFTFEEIAIKGYIRPEAAQLGQAAELFVVARIDGSFLMRTANDSWAAWNGRVPDLQAWRSGVTLQADNAVDVFSGRIGAPGAYVVFLGYRASDGVLRYSPAGQRLELSTVTAASWSHDDAGWNVFGTPPACPTPLLTTPVDLARVTSILYPGQVRGGNYKPHGGFRFDGPGQRNAENVVAAMSGTVYRGARYIEAGEVQYLFDIIHPCGVMLRYDHLRELSPKFAAIAATLPPATASSATTQLQGHTVSAGDGIGTAIGFAGNVAVDFGVYDLRTRNPATSNRGGELAPFGICWFDSLPASDSARVRALPPADGMAGATSDYCR